MISHEPTVLESEKKVEYCEPPTHNLKCIVFTIFMTVFYLAAVNGKGGILDNQAFSIFTYKELGFALTLYVPYLAMAYYDEWYSCKRTFGPTFLSLFYMFAKPSYSKQQQQYKSWCKKWKQVVYVVDVFVLVSLAMLSSIELPLLESLNIPHGMKATFLLFGAAAALGLLRD